MSHRHSDINNANWTDLSKEKDRELSLHTNLEIIASQIYGYVCMQVCNINVIISPLLQGLIVRNI